MDAPDVSSIESRMQDRLPGRLFEHSRRVARLAAQLAGLHGSNVDWIYLAGLYHDLGKTLDLAQMRATADRGEIPFDDLESDSPSLLHSAASAALFRIELEAPDKFVRAVRGHTIGGAPFCREEQILYIADFSEPGRTHEECETVRRMAQDNLVQAALETVIFKLRFLMLRQKSIHPRSVALYNFLLKESTPA